MSDASKQTCANQKGAWTGGSFAWSIGLAIGMVLATRSAVAAADFHCSAGDVPCLIAAIHTANGNGEGDTIVLDAGTYTLTTADNEDSGPSGLPSISSDITIQGAGATTTVIQRDASSQEEFRILYVAAAGDLKLVGLTVSRGYIEFTFPGAPGSGIYNQGALTITDSVFTLNFNGGSVGGIFSEGTLTISGSRVVGNFSDHGGPGGIYSSGTMEIDTSTVSENSAEAVGGIVDFGIASITDSVVANNHSGDFSLPAGIENFGTLTITNTTIAGNSAVGEGGGILNWGNVGIFDSTISDNHTFVNGGGIANLGSGTFELQNTILARNTAHVGPAQDCFGPITSLGHNIVGDPTGCTITLLGTDKTGDPGLGSFQDDGTAGNGHVPLLVTSQAIDAGDPSSCTATDQLGRPRVDGDSNGSVICDMGAVEFIPSAAVVNELVTLLSVTQARDRTPVPGGPAGTLTITATFKNTSQTGIQTPFFRVTALSNGNLLLNADGGPVGVGAKMTPNVGADGALTPDESVVAEFVVGLRTSSSFYFLVDLWGVPNP